VTSHILLLLKKSSPFIFGNQPLPARHMYLLRYVLYKLRRRHRFGRDYRTFPTTVLMRSLNWSITSQPILRINGINGTLGQLHR